MKKLALVGTTCSLKTSTINALLEKNYGNTIAFIPEAARLIAEEKPELFLDNERLAERQSCIAIRQLQLEQIAASCISIKLLVLDRCILDTYLYCLVTMGTIPKDIEMIYRDLMPSYDRFCLFDPTDIIYMSDDVRRFSANSDLRTRWHEAFNKELKLYHDKLVFITGNLEKRVFAVQKVMDDLLNQS